MENIEILVDVSNVVLKLVLFLRGQTLLTLLEHGTLAMECS